MSPEHLILIVNIASTWYMVGVIWFVQLVHYPLFKHYPREGYLQTAQEHQRRTAWVVTGPMLLELVSSVGLLFLRPEATPISLVILGNLSVAVWGCSTLWLQIPLHERLGTQGYDLKVIQQLIQTNWIRTVAWSLHGGVCWGLFVKSL